MQQIEVRQIVSLINRSIAHLNKDMVGHNVRVTYHLINLLKDDPRFTTEELCQIAWVVLYHDIGILKNVSVKQLIEEEFSSGHHFFSHSEYGALFIKYFSPYSKYAPLVQFHHSNFEEYANIGLDSKIVEIICLLRIIDIIDLGNIVNQKFNFKVNSQEDILLKKVQDYFEHTKELTTEQYNELLCQFLEQMELSIDERYKLLKLITYIFDFKSRATAIHCSTIVKVSETLARLFEVDKDTYRIICLGALLHDLGKIAIPDEILESKGKLSDEEFSVMKQHVLHTEKILEGNVDQRIINVAIRHHETLDGKGYPYGLSKEQLTLSECIVSTADIISALSQERSYKPRLSLEEVCEILNNLVDQGKICKNVVGMFINHKEEIYEEINKLSSDVNQLYDTMINEYKQSGYAWFS